MRVQSDALENQDDARLLIRDMLDNRTRAESVHHWPMQDFLVALTALARRVQPQLTVNEALGRIYLVLGAINFFSVSGPTLTAMLGEPGYAALKAQAPQELRRLIRATLGAAT
jgi:hypothetical protein